LKLLGTDPKINQKIDTTGSLGPQNDPKPNKSESVGKAPKMDNLKLLGTDSKINQKIKNTGSIEPQNNPKRSQKNEIPESTGPQNAPQNGQFEDI
jgi:hypothetical protein